jgi:hypothetical protein
MIIALTIPATTGAEALVPDTPPTTPATTTLKLWLCAEMSGMPLPEALYNPARDDQMDTITKLQGAKRTHRRTSSPIPIDIFSPKHLDS